MNNRQTDFANQFQYNHLYHTLKQAIYYEPDLIAQYSISEYEANIKEKKETENLIGYLDKTRKEFSDELSVNENLTAIINKHLNQIGYHILPKTISDTKEKRDKADIANHKHAEEPHTTGKTLSNITAADELYWDDVNYVFDIPIPLLLLDVWWCKEVGFCFDEELSDSCYANRLYRNEKYTRLNENGERDNYYNTRLFKKYIDQYNAWRSKAVTEARGAYEKGNDVTILSLDFTKYYYSIDIDFDSVRKKILEKHSGKTGYGKFYLYLTNIIEQIHLKCTNKIENYAKLTHPFIFTEEFGSENAQKKILPIGLFSSKILANWYLKEFDRNVIERLSPIYYGRYVDDLLIVLSKPKFRHNDISNKLRDEDFPSILDRYLLSTKLFEKVNNSTQSKNILSNTWNSEQKKTKECSQKSPEESDEKYSIIAENIPRKRIILKNDKLKIFQIDANYSKAMLDLMLKNIEEAEKVFNYLPSDDLTNTLSENVYQLIFEDKKFNKIRGIDRIAINPTALSVLIAKEAYNLRITNTPEAISDAFLDKLLADIKGMNYLEYVRVWEKLFTLFVLSGNRKRFRETYTDILSTIYRLKYAEDRGKTVSNCSTMMHFSVVDDISVATKQSKPRTELSLDNHLRTDDSYATEIDTQSKDEIVIQLNQDVCGDLTWYLNYSAGIALSLLSETERKEYISETCEISEENRDEIIESANTYRTADMFRHHHLAYPLLNYVTVVDENKTAKRYSGNLCGVDIFSPDILRIKQNEHYELDEERVFFSPRYVHHHEFQLFYAWKMLREEGVLTKLVPSNNTDEIERVDSYLTNAICIHKRYSSRGKGGDNRFPILEEIPNIDVAPSVLPTQITVCGQEKNLSKIRVGITNITNLGQCIQSNIHQLSRQNISLTRWKEIARILNTAALNRCNLVVFPECSIPARWLSPLTLWSREHQIGIIFGMEYIYVPTKEMRKTTTKDRNSENTAYNITAAILPYQIKQEYKSCCVSLRIKNHYSHDEVRLLKENRHNIPENVSSPLNKTAVYHLYSWRGNQFTVYNCFELADITHRSIFKSELDFLVACTYNKDAEYFYDILDSTVRDLHCYAVHVNCAEYGCSRAIQPVEHVKRNLATVGGGVENSLLVTELDIKKLAAFQAKGYNPADKSFKPLPPGFDSQKVINRHKVNDTEWRMDNEIREKQTNITDFDNRNE